MKNVPAWAWPQVYRVDTTTSLRLARVIHYAAAVIGGLLFLSLLANIFVGRPVTGADAFVILAWATAIPLAARLFRYVLAGE